MKRLSGKQRKMITERLKDRTATNAEIIKRAGYNVSNDHTASQIYLENLKKPEIRNLLEPVINEMEDTLINTVRDYKQSDKIQERSLAVDTAKWIHDKVKGKATQRVEQHTTSVKLSLSLKQITDTEQIPTEVQPAQQTLPPTSV